MTVGILTFEIHLGGSRSLKDRRQSIRRLKDRLRAHHNVSVSELGEFSGLRQRAGLAVVSVASGRDALERLFEAVLREAESEVAGDVIETGADFIEASDGGPRGWERDPR